MARIKSVLTEREFLFNRCVELAEKYNSKTAVETGERLVREEEMEKFRVLRNKRWFRKRIRYQKGIYYKF